MGKKLCGHAVDVSMSDVFQRRLFQGKKNKTDSQTKESMKGTHKADTELDETRWKDMN